MSLQAQFIHLEERLKTSKKFIGRYTLGMIFLFLCLEETPRLSFHGHKILMGTHKEEQMRYHDMLTFWFLFLCLLFASRLVVKI